MWELGAVDDQDVLQRGGGPRDGGLRENVLILPRALLWLNAAALYELEMIPFKRQMWC